MLALLITLLIMYVRVRKVRYDWKLSIPVSVYLGWISVATIANITSYLYSIGWDGFGITDGVWALILLAVASILGVFMLDRNKDIICAGTCLGFCRYHGKSTDTRLYSSYSSTASSPYPISRCTDDRLEDMV
jgi:ABC-type transport system involved in multi-copper enzyme maturation permease subunit